MVFGSITLCANFKGQKRTEEKILYFFLLFMIIGLQQEIRKNS
jgi:hypothetical protein